MMQILKMFSFAILERFKYLSFLYELVFVVFVRNKSLARNCLSLIFRNFIEFFCEISYSEIDQIILK